MEQHLNYHNPVMLVQSIDGLNIKSDGIYVDATFGAGGHSRAILEKLDENGKLFAFDQDTDAKNNLINDPRFTFINHNFKYLKNHLKLYGVEKIDGILADLGVSSHQFDCENRGFSYRFDCDLDMRMDTRKSFKASDILHTYTEAELCRVFYQYGEIKNAKKLAQLIVNERNISPFSSSKDFIARIKPCIPAHREFKYLSQLYQSIRLVVNDEVAALRALLEQSVSLLNAEGRIVIISYHSLEDRLVKIFFRSGNFDDIIDKDLYGNVLSPFTVITRKAITPDEQELKINNRSRSAKLRIAEKVTVCKAKKIKNNN
jgi:16S rRNA (cytosine1402-N4)-methyltransferase